MQRVALRAALAASRHDVTNTARFIPQRSMSRGLAVAAAAVAVVGVGASSQQHLAQCKDKKRVGEKVYSPGKAVGEGLKGEIWKAKHPDVTMLDTMEDSPALMLLSHVRSAETTGAAFVSYTDRLLRLLLDAACLALPNDDEAEFDVPGGARAAGQLSTVDGKVYAVTLLQDGEDLQLPLLGPLLPGDKARRGLWGKAVADTFQATGVAFGHIAVKDAMHVDARSVPADIKDAEAVLLLASELAGAEPVLAALEHLQEMGVDVDNVVLVCATISKAACEKASAQAKGLNIVTAAVDPDVGAHGHVVPGIGGLYHRYTESMEEMKHDSPAGKHVATPSQQPRKRILGLF
eukprot:TRINITY_DN5004_c0_g1_i1.p2 TRINITY_DN5004_c0_g1~~TRINITY_DN5004_c0_g1_i1.p2  ORF type:complete len:348 (-),score=139.93 TRINITY_DN5004_c0_g1_i1:1770-2813(-)